MYDASTKGSKKLNFLLQVLATEDTRLKNLPFFFLTSVLFALNRYRSESWSAGSKNKHTLNKRFIKSNSLFQTSAIEELGGRNYHSLTLRLFILINHLRSESWRAGSKNKCSRNQQLLKRYILHAYQNKHHSHYQICLVTEISIFCRLCNWNSSSRRESNLNQCSSKRWADTWGTKQLSLFFHSVRKNTAHITYFLTKMKVKELEQEHREEMLPLNSIDTLRTATPTDRRASSRDEPTSEVDPRILKSSNSVDKQVVGHSSVLLKGRESLHEIKRKREAENSFGLPITSVEKKMMVPIESNRTRKIDPAKAFGRLTRGSKGGPTQKVSFGRINKEEQQQGGAKEKDRARSWIR